LGLLILHRHHLPLTAILLASILVVESPTTTRDGMMHTILTAVVLLVLAAYSVTCIVRPHQLAAYIRGCQSRTGRFIQRWPFAGIVTKEWFPTYVRIMGVSVLLIVAVCASLLASAGR